MDIQNNDIQNRSSPVVKAAGIVIILAFIVLAMFLLRTILVPLTFALIFSLILYPTVQLLENWKMSRGLAIAITILASTLVVLSLLFFASIQVSSFSEQAPALTKKLNNWLNRGQTIAEQQFGIKRNQQVEQLQKYGNDMLKSGASSVTGVLSTATNILFDLTLIPLYIFFFLYYRDFFKEFIRKIFSATPPEKIKDTMQKINAVVRNYLSGLVIVIAIVATLNTAALLILGIDYAIFFGVLAAILLIIPYIGIAIGSALPAIMALITKDSAWYAVGVIAIFWFVQLLEGNFITPYIVGSKVSVNPFVAIVVLIMGGLVWGIPGLILALPLTAIMKVIFDASEPLQPYGFLLGQPGGEPPQAYPRLRRSKAKAVAAK